MHTPVQVTVVEYVSEFFRKYKSRAYGKSISLNAKGGADALMGMLKLVLSKGGREELRIALHCFKDQLTAAINSTPATRNQQVEELFALLSSLVDAAERLRQFSPVKESISCAVLEEVRWRLFRMLAGDGFSEDADIRRRALDLVFLSYMREQAELQQQQQRHKQLVAGGAAAAAGLAAGPPAAAAAGVSSGGGGLSGRPGSPSKAARLLQRRAVGIAGPDVSSWEGLWCSLAAMSGRRMLPLLQSVMADLYLGKHIPGTPAAATTAAATAAAAATGLPAKAGALQPAAKQQAPQLQQQQPAGPSKLAGASLDVAAASAAVGTAAAAVGEVDAACGVHTPPQRSSDNDAPESSSSQQQDVGGSPSSVDAAAVVTAAPLSSATEAALQAGSSPAKQQQQQQLEAAASADADDTDIRDEGAGPAAEMQPTTAAAASASDEVLQDADPAATSSAELPAGVVYAPVLDRSTWVSCASSSFCATETGSIDGSAFALSEASLPVATSAAAAYDSVDGVALSQQREQQQQQDDQACYSPCSSPPGPGRSRFAAKLERLKESVKESVSIGGSSGSGSSSAGPAWKQLPRAWVQQLRHGHDKEKDKEQQQQQVSDLDVDQQQQGQSDVQAAGVGGSSSRVKHHEGGDDCAGVPAAASLAASAAQ